MNKNTKIEDLVINVDLYLEYNKNNTSIVHQ